MTKLFKGMPMIMMGIFAIFALIPFWSLTFVSNPFFKAVQYPLTGGAHLAAFIIFPVMICIAILMKHPLVFAIFLLECASLLLLAFISETPMAIAWIQAALVILFAISAAVIADTDLLFPFLNSNARVWRRHSRTPTTIQAQIQLGGTPIQAMISDISTLGFGVMVDRSRYPDFTIDQDQKPILTLPTASSIPAISTDVAWIRNPEGFVQIGLRATSPFNANEIVKVTGQKGLEVQIPLLAPLVNTPTKRKILSVTCLLVLIGIFAMRFLMYRAEIDTPAQVNSEVLSN